MDQAGTTDREAPCWGVRPATKQDRPFLAGLGDPTPGGARTREFVIEADHEPIGRLIIERVSGAVDLREVVLLPEWLNQGIEADAIGRVRGWAEERRLSFTAPDKKLVVETPRIARIKGSQDPAASSTDWVGFGLAMLGFIGFAAICYGFDIGRASGVRAPVWWFRPDPLRAGLFVLVCGMFGALTPLVVAEVRGRLAGGPELLDLGNPGRKWWLLTVFLLTVAAGASFVLIGTSLPGAGSFGWLFVAAATISFGLALRRGRVLQNGIIRQGLPGFVPLDSINDWGRVGSRLHFRLRRPSAGFLTDLLRVTAPQETADQMETGLRPILGEPEVRPAKAVEWRPGRLQPAGLFLMMAFIMTAMQYSDDLPRERPPGPLSFGLASDSPFEIGKDNPLRICPHVYDESTGKWEGVLARCFDLSGEKIELVLRTRNAAGAPVETVMSSRNSPGSSGDSTRIVRGEGRCLRVSCRVPADSRPGQALLLVYFTDRDGRTHEPSDIIVELR